MFYDIIFAMKKEEIIQKLKDLKPQYSREGLIIRGLFGSYSRDEETDSSDIDILIESTPDFASRYGFKAISRLNEIKEEISTLFGLSVDLADCTGMGKTGKKFIIDRTIYV
jgi:predicted nucleotidyltransferase